MARAYTHTLIHTPLCSLQCVYFVNSGSEANDLAMIMARMHTQNWDMLCLRNAYHGMSIGTMGTCGQHTWKQAMPQVGMGGGWVAFHRYAFVPA
eukprot:915545-Pelagomonas_calceolata.AAC.1